MPLPSTSPIQTLYEYDHANYLEVTRCLPGQSRLLDDLANLYQTLHGVLDPALAMSGKNARVAGVLYVQCFQHLVLASLALLRLYSKQAARETRAAVEAIGIA